MAPSGVLGMRGAAVRLPRRRCASSAPSPPFLLQSLSVHQRLGTQKWSPSHIITLIGGRRATCRIPRLSRIPGAKRVVGEYVVDGPTLKNKKGSVCRRWPRRWIELPQASLHNRARGTSTTRTQPVGAGCLSTPGARLLLAYCRHSSHGRHRPVPPDEGPGPD